MQWNRKQVLRSGFSLVEVLASITIITLVASLSLANYAQIRAEGNLKNDVSVVVAGLGDVVNQSLSPSVDASPGFVFCGMRVPVVSGASQIVPQVYQATDCETEVGAQTIDIEDKTITLSSSAISSSSFTLGFDAPFASVNATVQFPAEITLTSLVDPSLSQTVSIGQNGLITVQ